MQKREPERVDRRPLTYGLLALIIVINVAGSLWWIERNVVQYGRDPGGYLVRSLIVAQELDPFTPAGLLRAFTSHDYRPPGLFLAVQPFYALLGTYADSAQMLNVLLLAAILPLTFALGKRVGGNRVGLLAAAMTGFFPLMAAMSRLFYTENLVTTAVVWSMLALLGSRDFTRRGWSLSWGLSLGLGLLVKWTIPIYTLVPTLIVLWWARLPAALARALRRPQIAWRNLAIAGALGFALSALAYWPLRSAALAFPSGDWLFGAWFLLSTLLIYLLLRPKTVLSNFFGGLILALLLASIWYVPRAGFISALSDVALGSEGGKFAPVDLLNLNNYRRYPEYVIFDHLGLLSSLLILPLGLYPWLRRLASDRGAHAAGWFLWSSLLSTLLILSLLSQDGERNLVPLLPLFAILLADGLRDYGRRRAIAIACVWLMVLGFQWTIFTFDAFSTFQQRTALLWGSSEHLVQPASETTDPGFWIAADVIESVGNGPLPASLAMLVNSEQIHRGQFRYLIQAQDLAVDVVALTEPDGRGWSDLANSHWVLVSDGDRGDIEGDGPLLIERILTHDPLFELIFDEAKRYALPNGDTAILYHRDGTPGYAKADPERLEAGAQVAESIARYWTDDAVLIFPDNELAYWVGLHDLPARNIVVVGPEQDVPTLLADTGARTLFAALAHDSDELQAGLDAGYIKALEVGNDLAALAIYGRRPAALVDLPLESGLGWQEVELIAARGLDGTQSGQVLPFGLSLQGQTDGSLKASVRLLDAEGKTVAQNDKIVTENIDVALYVPPTALPGQYTLSILFYRPEDEQPLLNLEGESSVPVTTISVTP